MNLYSKTCNGKRKKSLSINKMLCGTSNVKFMFPVLNRMTFYLTGSRDPNLLYHRLDLLPANNMCLHLKQLATEGKIFYNF